MVIVMVIMMVMIMMTMVVMVVLNTAGSVLRGGDGLRCMVHSGVCSSSVRQSVQAAIRTRRHERDRRAGNCSVFRGACRSADGGKLRDGETKRNVRHHSRPAHLPHLQTLQTFSGLSGAKN